MPGRWPSRPWSHCGGAPASKLRHHTQRRPVFRDARPPSITAHTLGHRDLDGCRLRFLGFREMHLEHPVCVVRRHPTPICIFGKREAAHEPPVRAFNPMIFSPLFFLFECPFARNRQNRVLYREAHILFLTARQLGLDEVFLSSSVMSTSGDHWATVRTSFPP